MNPKRILLKISGEALGVAHGIDADRLQRVAQQLAQFHHAGIQLSVVCGGGNWLRGRDIVSIERSAADQIGMLATVMNGIALESALLKMGVHPAVYSALPVSGVRLWDKREAVCHLENNGPVIFVGGTGNPYFTTDSAAALRAIQVGASRLLKATKVDGIYDKDPVVHPSAKRFDTLTFDEAIDKRLKIMDLTAFDLCRQYNVSIQVFNMEAKGIVDQLCCGSPVGTIVTT